LHKKVFVKASQTVSNKQWCGSDNKAYERERLGIPYIPRFTYFFTCSTLPQKQPCRRIIRQTTTEDDEIWTYMQRIYPMRFENWARIGMAIGFTPSTFWDNDESQGTKILTSTNVLPVKANRQKAESFVTIWTPKNAREVRRLGIGKTKYWKAYPYLSWKMTFGLGTTYQWEEGKSTRETFPKWKFCGYISWACQKMEVWTHAKNAI
jgi:hypothetical protein